MASSSRDTDPSLERVQAGARGADRKLAADPVIIDVGDVIGITEWFLVVSGRNARQVRAIVDEVELEVALDDGPRPLRVEGRDTCEWVLMDYGDFVVHVFDSATREVYDLERLWSDRPRVEVELDEVGTGT